MINQQVDSFIHMNGVVDKDRDRSKIASISRATLTS